MEHWAKIVYPMFQHVLIVVETILSKADNVDSRQSCDAVVSGKLLQHRTLNV